MSNSTALVYNSPEAFSACPYLPETITVVGVDGKAHVMDLAAVDQIIHWACSDIADVNPRLLISRSRKSLSDGMKANAVGIALVNTAYSLIETEPAYSQVSARLLLDSLWGEVRVTLGQETAHGGDYRAAEYPALFVASIHAGVERELVPQSLLRYDLHRLARSLQPERDLLFTYPGLQALYDQHLLHAQGGRLELPQIYFMRVAMELALGKDDRDSRAIEVYAELSRFDYRGSGWNLQVAPA